jgi:2-hydroxychromene-2-carboxylate isomerase
MQLSSQHAEKLPDAIAALYQSFWVERNQIQEPSVILAALAKVLGEDDGKMMLESAGKKEVKEQLAKNTDAAFESGAFGLPWFVGEFDSR